jgi:hypothetical protein
MRKSIYWLSVAFLTLLTSCEEDNTLVDINCEYPGAIIYGKDDVYGYLYYDLKYKGRTFTVTVYEIDFNYSVGDTVNGPCRNN